MFEQLIQKYQSLQGKAKTAFFRDNSKELTTAARVSARKPSTYSAQTEEEQHVALSAARDRIKLLEAKLDELAQNKARLAISKAQAESRVKALSQRAAALKPELRAMQYRR